MILDRLIELRDRLPGDALVPEAYEPQKVRWMLEVSADGRFAGLIETGPKRKDWKELPAPFTKRSGKKPPPQLLVDKPGYLFGLAESDAKRTDAENRQRAYLDLLDDAARDTGDSDVALLARVLRDPEQVQRAREALTEQKGSVSDFIAPRVGGAFPHQRRSIQRFWAKRQSDKSAKRSLFVAGCLACGEERPIAQTHPIKMKLGGETPEPISMNEAAFRSHGLRQSENAPLCRDCAVAYGEALRFLLQSDEHRLYVGGGVTWLFWTREPVDDLAFGSLLSDPKPEDVARLLKAPRTGHLPDTDANAFYALVVSANKSRLVVRDWLALPVAEVRENLAKYFERQRVLDYKGESPPLKLAGSKDSLTAALVPRKKGKPDFDKLPPQTTDALLAHALTGRPLPVGLLHQAVQRARAEETPVSRPRASLLRLILSSLNVVTTEALAPTSPNAAYHCGRLLAVLDGIQQASISANATLVDRFYGSASTTPSAVLGTLVTKAQPHLAKLRKTKGGLYRFFEEQIKEIADHFDPAAGFPRTLTPEEQGLFALGFYQQKNRRRKADAEVPDAPDTSDEPTANA